MIDFELLWSIWGSKHRKYFQEEPTFFRVVVEDLNGWPLTAWQPLHSVQNFSKVSKRNSWTWPQFAIGKLKRHQSFTQEFVVQVKGFCLKVLLSAIFQIFSMKGLFCRNSLFRGRSTQKWPKFLFDVTRRLQNIHYTFGLQAEFL